MLNYTDITENTYIPSWTVDGVDWINMAESRDKSRDVVNTVMDFRVS